MQKFQLLWLLFFIFFQGSPSVQAEIEMTSVFLINSTLEVMEGQAVEICAEAVNVVPLIRVMLQLQFITADDGDIIFDFERNFEFNREVTRQCTRIGTRVNNDGISTNEMFATVLFPSPDTPDDAFNITQNTTVVTIIERIPTISLDVATKTVLEGNIISVCATGTNLSRLPVFIDMQVRFITADENDVILQDLRPPLRFTAERPRNCTIIRTLVNNDELQEETFAVSITSSPVNELNPVRIIRNITTVTIEDRQFTITAPPLVNVSEGIPAVVCYTIIPIRRLLEREEEFSRINNLTLTLNIQDISTSSDDYNQESIPRTLVVPIFQRTCLRIPTFKNDDGNNSTESFEVLVVNVTSSPPIPLPLGERVTTQVRLSERCVDHDLKLVNGSTEMEGRVEICFNGTFGALCDIGLWTQRDAFGVCNQLGFPITPLLPELELRFPKVSNTFGHATGPVLVGRFDCGRIIERERGPRCLVSESLPLPQICTPNAGVICKPPEAPIGVTTPPPSQTTQAPQIGDCEPNQFACTEEIGRCLDPKFVCDGIPDCFNSTDELECNRTECTQGNIRPLVGGASSREGLVEVCAGGRFLPVAMDNFTITEASVMCRQLDLGSAGYPISASNDLGLSFSQSPKTVIQCNGEERRLFDCTLAVISDSGESAAIQCLDATQCRNGEMRLVPESPDISSGREGRLEICYQGIWGAVYDPDWSALDAAVTCQQLNFEPKGALPFISAVYPTDSRTLPIVYDCPSCSIRSIQNGTLLGCPRERISGEIEGGQLGMLTRNQVGRAALSGVVGVKCEVYPDDGCTQSDVRLSYRGRNNATGNLEICNNDNTWNSVCLTSLINQEQSVANVTCRALGFTYFERNLPPFIYMMFNHGVDEGPISVSGPIYEQAILCDGTESDLTGCQMMITDTPVSCNTVRIQCLSQPQIFVDPPVFSGAYVVEENRNAQLSCFVDQESHPSVILRAEPFQAPDKRRKRSPITSNTALRTSIYTSPAAMLSDNGAYICEAINTTTISSRNVKVVVEGPRTSAVPQYIRFSIFGPNRLNLEFGNSSVSKFILDTQNSVVLPSINPNLPGSQNVKCQRVARREADEERDFERVECIILQSNGSQNSTPTAVAELAASVIQRLHPDRYFFFNISSTGFCDSDLTEFSGRVYSWPETEGGNEISIPCPSTNKAITRQCNVEGTWLQPDTSRCLVDTINDLNKNLSAENYVSQVEELATNLNQTVMDPTLQTMMLLEAVSNYMENVSALVNNMTVNVTIPKMVVDNLVISLSSLQQWPAAVTASSFSSRVVMSFESIVAQYSQEIFGRTFSRHPGLIVVAENTPVEELRRTGRTVTFGEGIEFTRSPAILGDLGLEQNLRASITLAPNLFDQVTDRETVGVFFGLYDEATLFPVRVMENNTRPQGIASPVVASTVGPGLDFSQLDPPVEIDLRITNTFNDSIIRGSETCVFWNFSAANGQGNWSTGGCTRVRSSNGVVSCACTHLTNFAILVDICERAVPGDCNNDPVTNRALSALTYIGAALSIFGLIITIITMLVFKKLRNRDASKFHIQLSIAIISILVVFLSGIRETAVYGGCVVVSLLLHYFTLSAILWMGAEALLMFQKLVLVFRKVTTKGLVITSLFCWLAPLIPVIISLIIDLANGLDPESDLIIRRNSFCFLSDRFVFGFAFLAPILAVLLFNIVIFVIVIVVLIKHTRGTLTRKKESIDRKTVIRLMISIGSIMFLFGFSWLFAALTINVREVRLAAQIIFTISSTFQGFFIFLFFCVFSKDARESWKEALSCGRYKSKHLNPNLKLASSSNGAKKMNAKVSSDFTSNTYSSKVQSSDKTLKKSTVSSTEDLIQKNGTERYEKVPMGIEMQEQVVSIPFTDSPTVPVQAEINVGSEVKKDLGKECAA